MRALLLATVAAAGGPGVPDDVVDRARVLVEAVLEGVRGQATLKLFRTRGEMEAAVREVDPRVAADFAAWTHYRSRTIFAYLAPRPDAALFGDGLPGLLEGALVHEAHHLRGVMTDPQYRARPPAVLEGEAERFTVAFLRDRSPGMSAWELVIASRLARLGAPTAPRELGAPPADPAERAAWYALAFVQAGGVTRPPPWVLYDGTADPRADGGYRLVALPGEPALLVRAAPGNDLEVDVTPLDVGKGQVELLFGFESRETYAKVAFLRRGGVRAMWKEEGRWRKEALHPAPPLPPGRTARLALKNGAVTVNGTPVLHLQQPPGRVGVGVWDAAADFAPSGSPR